MFVQNEIIVLITEYLRNWHVLYISIIQCHEVSFFSPSRPYFKKKIVT
jgi:hypothetical protein